MSLLGETLTPFRPALALTVAMTLVTGVAYPALVTGVGHALFPRQAGGSLVTRNGRAVGSALIGQSFAAPGYFWSRPSATTKPYDAGASSGSNLGPANPALAKAVAERVAALKAAGPVPPGPVPADLVTASASGLDPDITPAAARYQLPRIAAARGLPVADLARLVAVRVAADAPALVGPPRVNVLALNMALDRLKPLPAMAAPAKAGPPAAG